MGAAAVAQEHVVPMDLLGGRWVLDERPVVANILTRQTIRRRFKLGLLLLGVLLTLWLTGTTLNVMSLMGVVMLAGIAMSNSILIVDFAHRLEEQGLSVADAVVTACRVRLRPILMTSLATIIGMIPDRKSVVVGKEC